MSENKMNEQIPEWLKQEAERKYPGEEPITYLQRQAWVVGAFSRSGGVWVKASQRLPNLEQVVVIKELLNGFIRLGNFFEEDGEIKLFIQTNGAHESFYITKDKFDAIGWLDESHAADKGDAIEFLDHIRDYERESGNQICYDERSSEELYDIFHQSK